MKFLRVFVSLSAFLFASSFWLHAFEVEPLVLKGGVVQAQGKSLSLVCKKSEGKKCLEYGFLLKKEGKSEFLKLTVPGEALEFLMMSDELRRNRLRKGVDNKVTERFNPFWFAPITLGQNILMLFRARNFKGAIALSVVSLPLDLALLPVTAVGIGVFKLVEKIRKVYVEKGMKVLFGMTQQESIKLSNVDFDLLVDGLRFVNFKEA